MINRRRSKYHPRIKVLLLCVILVLVFGGIVISLLDFIEKIPTSETSNNTVTDAIVVLTGGSRRLEEGLHLLSKKRAKKLFVSGVYRGVDVRRLLAHSRGNPEELVCCIKLGYTAENTQGNAAETSTWLKSEGYKSIRLVTASYHIPRSIKEFYHKMPDIVIIPHAVFPKQFKRYDWWRWPGTASLILTESFKFQISSVRLLKERPPTE